jgi:hypothetical protein
MPPKYWAIVCDETEAPGLWEVWRKEHCVAIGWSPDKNHLVGPTNKPNWEKARKRAQEIKVGDIVIPYLTNFRFGIPGRVLRLAIRDEEWNPTVQKGTYGDYPPEDRLGRRVMVEWLRGPFPSNGDIAVVPKGLRTRNGEVHHTIERIKRKRLARFLRILADRKNYRPYKNSMSQVSEKFFDRTDKRPVKREDVLSAKAVSVDGDTLYLERARAAFPILVRQAHSGQKIVYSDLATELGMTNARNLNDVLRAVGNAIKALSSEWDEEIPLLQCVVVNRRTGLPGEGVAVFLNDVSNFAGLSRSEKEQVFDRRLIKVFSYPKWEQVLEALKLNLVPSRADVDALIEKARMQGGVGEGEDHKRLKHYVAANPSVIGLSGFGQGRTEYPLPSADEIDVVFEKQGCWVGVEVKGPSSHESDIARGMFQTVKYTAVREAHLKWKPATCTTTVILVTSSKLSPRLKLLKDCLGIDVREGIIAPIPTK